MSELRILEDDVLDEPDWREMRIVAAAVLFEGKIYTMEAPARHWNIVHAMAESGIPQDQRSTQGFLTSSNTFVRRRPALMIAENAKQLLRPIEKNRTQELFSEDVW